MNRFQEIDSASLWSLADWWDNPIPNRFLYAPRDCSKSPAQLCSWNPNKLWRSNSIFNLWYCCTVHIFLAHFSKNLYLLDSFSFFPFQCFLWAFILHSGVYIFRFYLTLRYVFYPPRGLITMLWLWKVILQNLTLVKKFLHALLNFCCESRKILSQKLKNILISML
jgi:hypothetical protein